MGRIIERGMSFSHIRVEFTCLGKDYLITVQGGQCPHIGCVVLALPRPSLAEKTRMSATSSVINREGHKDEAICRLLAEALAIKKESAVVCTGGFHVDNITPEQINEVMETVRLIAEEL